MSQPLLPALRTHAQRVRCNAKRWASHTARALSHSYTAVTASCIVLLCAPALLGAMTAAGLARWAAWAVLCTTLLALVARAMHVPRQGACDRRRQGSAGAHDTSKPH